MMCTCRDEKKDNGRGEATSSIAMLPQDDCDELLMVCPGNSFQLHVMWSYSACHRSLPRYYASA